MRIVVTGGAGFIGANLCQTLLALKVPEIVVIDDFSTGTFENLEGLPVEIHDASILDRVAVDKAVTRADSIIHLAARPSVPRSLADPLASNEVNVSGTLKILEAARRAGAHVVVASSSSVYGGNRRLPKREDMLPRPLSPYAVSKLAAESYALSYATCFDLPVLAVRFFNVFGPMQSAGHAYAAVIPRFVEAAVNGHKIQVHGDGQQTRDFTYVRSVTEILADAALRRIVHNGPVNLAFGTRTSLLTVISLLERIIGCRLDVEHVASRPGDVRDSQADTKILRTLFPAAALYGLEPALAATVQWYTNKQSVDQEVPAEPSVQIASR
ncbi:MULTISPECIES: NAD-dependent epimerase/dehydratase family protein [unclassified Frankia]|uniref:NAD-dependent epimerase/dehydratase family protein n=1 Tax=unclassified Frankia TaxID=2632575 RepID=UPI002AD44C14|nr:MULTISPECIES: NAD-dependent epimerase/dehydratase family protein [unclassified Frankia]